HDKRVTLRIIPCGPRTKAFRAFELALETHPDAFNILLVDAEGPVHAPPWQHVQSQDRWSVLDVGDEHCHLMVQTMEAWLVADREALSRFYGQGFRANSIPRRSNVEQIDKSTLEARLKTATRHTSKGEYHKIHHGCKLLAQLDRAKVRQAAPHCE